MTTTLAADRLASAAEAQRLVLPNGLTLLIRRDRSAAAVAIVTYVKAGYFDETDDIVGVAHVLEHMYFKGTPSRAVGQIARETKASGGYLNAHTIYDHTSYYTVVPASQFAEGLAIQADAYAHSSIDAGELAKELEVIIQEVHRKEDAPSAVATEALYALLHDRHRIRRWRMGRPAQLRDVTRDQVAGFYHNFYRPRNTILSVVGDVDPDAVWREVERRYGALTDDAVQRTPGPVEAGGLSGARYREWDGDIAQTQIVMGWRTVAALHADTPLLDLAALILGTGRASRLYRALRERQLASSVSAYNYTPTELGVFVVHAECPPDVAAAAGPAMWAQVASLRDDGVGGRELTRAQRLLESRWVRRTESMEGQAAYLAEWEALGDWSLGDRYLERALAATPEDVTGAVRRYLGLTDAGVTVYRPADRAVLASAADGLLLPRDAVRPAPLDATRPGDADTGTDTNTDTNTDANTDAVHRGIRLEREEGGARVYRTARGVPIIVRRKVGAQVTHAGVYVLGGPRDEGPSRGGLTALMARSAVKGAAGRGAAELAEAVEMLGGSLAASVGGENFGWSISVPSRSTSPALELLADVVQRPTLADASLETERTLALAELATLRDDMYRYPMRLATEAAYGEHPYGVGALGSDASLRAVTGEEVRAWHARRVLGGPAVIAVVADLDPDELAAAIARGFGDLRPGQLASLEAPVWPATALTRVEQRDKAQTALALAFPGPDRADDDRIVSMLIAGIASGLGGRFFEELRDRRSLAYTVHALTVERMLGGMFVGYIATSPDKEATARGGLLAEFAKLSEVGVGEEELARAQTYAIGTHAIARQSGATVLGEVIDAWQFGRDLAELDTFETRVRAVTTDAVLRVARRYFDPARVVAGIVRGRG